MIEAPTPAVTVERTVHSAQLVEAAFGDIVRDAHTIADIGAGDSSFGAALEDQGKKVVRIDAQYGTHSPDDTHHAIAARAEQLPLPEGGVDVAVSAFMFQHLPDTAVAPALNEMLRVTKPAQTEKPDQGLAAIFPVFDSPKLKRALREAGLTSVAMVGKPDEVALSHYPKLFFDTLVIRNDPARQQELAKLASVVSATEALRPKSVGARLGSTARHLGMRRRHSPRMSPREFHRI